MIDEAREQGRGLVAIVTRKHAIGGSVIVWILIGLFWLLTTRGFHPTLTLGVVVTVSLVTAYALASYLNHLVLIPRLLRSGQTARYVAALCVIMLVFTAVALAIIRTAYAAALGPDHDPNGLYRHYAIDLFGMAVHVGAAALVVWLARRVFGRN